MFGLETLRGWTVSGQPQGKREEGKVTLLNNARPT